MQSPGKSNKREILAIVGPKGGVGKSIISANLSIALAQRGRKVVAVDLDLGAANLHAMFGMRESRYALDDFVMNRVRNLAEVVADTGTRNLGMISGGDVPGIANLAYQKKMKLIGHLLKLDSDVVLLDLGAGASNNVIDFLIIAQRGLMVTTPEVPSLLNLYSFIKSTIFRRLAFHFKRNNASGLLDLLEKAKDPQNNPQLKTMEGFLSHARRIHPGAAESAARILAGFRFLIVVNRVMKPADANAGEVVQNLLRQYLNIDSSVTMIIREDPAVRSSMTKLRPIMIENPASLFCQDIVRIAARLFPTG